MATLEETYDAAAAAYRDDPTDENRAAYEKARDELQAKRTADREGRDGAGVVTEEG